MRLSSCLLLLAACGGSQTSDSTPEPVEVEPVETTGEPVAVGDPDTTGETASRDTSACSADSDHCCQPDGSIVRPGGCQPIYRDDQVPSLLRGPDGRCIRDERPCRVRCLPAGTRIATPEGDAAVETLNVGDRVFTLGESGPVAVPIVRVGAVPLSGPHQVVEIRLSDGRRVVASGAHPTAGGVELGSLSPGDELDGAVVHSVESVPYEGTHTYDIRPAGATGVYWADDVALGSTL